MGKQLLPIKHTTDAFVLGAEVYPPKEAKMCKTQSIYDEEVLSLVVLPDTIMLHV